MELVHDDWEPKGPPPSSHGQVREVRYDGDDNNAAAEMDLETRKALKFEYRGHLRDLFK